MPQTASPADLVKQGEERSSVSIHQKRAKKRIMGKNVKAAYMGHRVTLIEMMYALLQSQEEKRERKEPEVIYSNNGQLFPKSGEI